jgi:hypothetical protein
MRCLQACFTSLLYFSIEATQLKMQKKQVTINVNCFSNYEKRGWGENKQDIDLSHSLKDVSLTALSLPSTKISRYDNAATIVCKMRSSRLCA